MTTEPELESVMRRLHKKGKQFVTIVIGVHLHQMLLADQSMKGLDSPSNYHVKVNSYITISAFNY